MFPAQALAKQLDQQDADVAFVGAKLDSNKYFFLKDRFRYRSIASASLSSKRPYDLLKLLISLTKGVLESLSFLRNERPLVIVGFGSFHTAPALLAARLLRIPVILFESNAWPGMVNRVFSRIASLSAVQFGSAAKNLKGVVKQVSVPFFKNISKEEITRREAFLRYCLDEDVFTLLVFGGSQGASSINKAVVDAIGMLKAEGSNFQILHFTGSEQQQEFIRDQYLSIGVSACVKAFEQEMIYAWNCADLVICRSGAASIAEIIEFEVPSILIPFPRAKENHQLINAKELEKLGASICLIEKDLSKTSLFSLIQSITDQNTRQKMVDALKQFKASSKKETLKDVVIQFVDQRR